MDPADFGPLWALFIGTLIFAWAVASITVLVVRKRRGTAAPMIGAPWGSPPALPPAGWYPDPSGGQAQRYWDGHQWGAASPPPWREI
ncbi:DUF2510 domain-containing protein [Mycobacterium sp. 1081908.1]|uniref:DUF2510 domain-containing protein n=1 Tax=Mycobacterium sp. 1081908.1 TaxID=1834066 RepID=UPI0009EF228D|nr:DUF2510 domain-containing protein [Mycobacterium sp. 1081908.1]